MNHLIIHFQKKSLFVRYKKTEENNTNILNQSSEVRISYFMKKVDAAIYLQMENSDFGIHRLCRTIGISRSQLHNKIKKETGLSTSHYINNVRLKKAQHLLKTTDLNLSEIAFLIGFNSLNYFSNTYFKKYGIRPSKVRT